MRPVLFHFLLPALLLPALLLVACGRDTSPSGPQAGGQETAASAPRGPKAERLLREFAGTPAPDVPLETGPDGAAETIADIRAAN
ncbi:MAG: hypothetical protein SNJ63_07135, partial [Sphingomonadaceae bacterium]